MFATVYSTFPDVASAERISQALLEKRLVACVNIFPIKSMFRWGGGIEKGEEFAALMKIRAEDYLLVQNEIARSHPYDVPCIVCYRIDSGLQPYLNWLMESTERPPED